MKSIALKEFKIIGVAVRTSNQNGQSEIDVCSLWSRFIEDALMEQIPNKESADVYSVYSDYESDQSYTTTIGCKVSSFEGLPEGFVGKTIPASKYELYLSTGKLPDCVVKTWTKIWASPIERSFIADFDIYGAQAQRPEDARVETYVSIIT